MLDEIAKFIEQPATVRVATLILACVLTAAWAHERIESVSYATVVQGVSTETERRIAEHFVSQSGALENWALALLGLITAAVVTSKVHKGPQVAIVFVALGPAFVTLLFSLRAARLLRMRLTNLYAFDNLTDLASVGGMLMQQSTLFFAGLSAIAVFTAWYLINIVAGRISPQDAE